MTRIISIVGGLQPSTPTIGTATAGDTTASVAFTPSTYIGKGTITYTATSSPGGITGTASSSPITVTGLTNGTAYTFTVTGTTNYGVTSIASGSSNSITPALGDTGSMFPIAAVTVSSPVATITFSNIPSTYTHLQLRGITRDTSSGVGMNNCTLYFNGDNTGANYSSHYLYGNGSIVGAGGAANSAGSSWFNAYTGQTGWAGVICDILDYSNTNKFKTCRTISAADSNGQSTNGSIWCSNSNWRSTNAITTIRLSTDVTFAQNTQFALYGIKGA